MPSTSIENLRQHFASHGQEHVFQFWDTLSPASRETFLAQLEEVDLAQLDQLTRTHLQGDPEANPIDLNALQPAPSIRLPEKGGDASAWAEAETFGQACLREGRVACFTVAGGQGTRLGYDGPKGTFPVTPVRRKTLFQVFAEKIQAASRTYQTTIPWFIMTSPLNHEATVKHFQENAFFGLASGDVLFFPQGQMPAVDEQGKLLLAEKDSLALSPDGHGGSLRALARHGALREMEKRGIDIISYFQVDNPLVEVLDPAFIGFHAHTGSEMSSRMIPKRSPGEKVGNFCQDAEGRIRVVEYSDMPDDLAQKTTADGDLLFNAGSIAIHLLDREFAHRMDADASLPFHQAHKKVPHLTPSGEKVNPAEPNAYKFEKFIFDALPDARQPLILETRREEQFSPVKNPSGEDSAESCQRDQVRLFLSWMQSAGIPLPEEARDPAFRLEISPLFAGNATEFASAWSRLDSPPPVTDGLYLGSSQP